MACSRWLKRRSRIVFLNVTDADDVNWRKIVASGHSHFLVYEGSPDHVLGMVSVKALWSNTAIGVPTKLRDHLTKPLFIPRSVTLVQLLRPRKSLGQSRRTASRFMPYGLDAGGNRAYVYRCSARLART
jgi:putative hemolysin